VIGDLQLDGEEKQNAPQCRIYDERHGIGHSELPAPEERERQHRRGRPQLGDHEAHRAGEAETQ
jgi:hypothetical protein